MQRYQSKSRHSRGRFTTLRPAPRSTPDAVVVGGAMLTRHSAARESRPRVPRRRRSRTRPGRGETADEAGRDRRSLKPSRALPRGAAAGRHERRGAGALAAALAGADAETHEYAASVAAGVLEDAAPGAAAAHTASELAEALGPILEDAGLSGDDVSALCDRLAAAHLGTTPGGSAAASSGEDMLVDAGRPLRAAPRAPRCPRRVAVRLGAP